MTTHRRVEVRVTRLATSGEGVGHVERGGESRAVFVPRAAPGDVLSCEVDWRSRPARGRTLALLTPGPGRRAPSCASFDRCGGCDFLHLAPETQLHAHGERLASALRGVSHPAPTLHPLEPSAGTRTRARLHVVGDKRGRIQAGFFEPGSHDVVAVDTCVALHPALDRARGELSALLASSVGKGEALLSLGKLEPERRAVLSLSWSGALPAAVFGRVESSVKEGRLAGARLLEKGATRPVSIGEPAPYTLGADGEALALAPGGFAQATESLALAEIVARRAKELLLAHGKASRRIVELHAGAGNFSVALARLGALSTWESDAEACEKARENLRARGLTADVRHGDADAVRPGKGAERPDLLVLDPPRTGARAVAETLAREPARAVLYVSCDPETLARDVALLGDAYRVLSVDIVPCFPDTSHVETVLALAWSRA